MFCSHFILFSFNFKFRFNLCANTAKLPLIKELNKKHPGKWNRVDKEAIYLASQELNISPEMVNKTIKEKNPSIFFDMFSAFSDHYVPDDVKIKKKVAAIGL